MGIGSKLGLCLQDLVELEAGLRQLTVAVLKLPSGDERRDILRAIGNFGQRINDVKQVATPRAMPEPNRSRQAAAPSRRSSPSPLSSSRGKEIARPENIVALTPRERQIMHLVSEGLSNK